MIECATCLLRFTTNKAFDMHRAGGYGDAIYKPDSKAREVIGYTPHTRHCLTEEEMSAKGMKRLDDGRWSTGIPFNKFSGGSEEDESEEIGEEETEQPE